jgi:hypothetical protein
MSNKLAVPMNGGVMFLRLGSFWGIKEEEARRIKKEIYDELRRAFDEARREGRPAAILMGDQVEVLYVGPDGNAVKLKAHKE